MDTILTTIDAALAHAAAVRPRIGGFPYLAEALRDAGVTNYYFDVSSGTVLYATGSGDVLQPGNRLPTDRTLVPPFDRAALVDAIRADQRGESEFAEFVEASWRAGVVRYEVDTAARTCSYFGAHGERYVENYPAVRLPQEAASRT